MTELGVFFDAGVAYNKLNQIVFSGSDPQNLSISRFVMSHRRQLATEPLWSYYHRTILRFSFAQGASGTFGINLVPGW
jgi:hypothetical protein